VHGLLNLGECDCCPLPLLGDGCLEDAGFFDFSEKCIYHGSGAGLSTWSHSSLQANASSTARSFERLQVIEPHLLRLDAEHAGSVLSQTTLDSSSLHDSFNWASSELFPSISVTSQSPDSYTLSASTCETTSPSASSGYNPITSQSTSSSPASSAPQLSCDFCTSPFSNVDSLW
jgi:hypothetical protein